jgi:hypothetical protein
MPFTENESYKHKLAKELLYKWLKEKKGGGKWVGDGVYLEYPLIPAMRNEYWKGDVISYGNASIDGYHYYEGITSDFNPTYEQCIANNDIPIAVLDIAVVYKGCLFEGYEVYHTHKVDDTKKGKIMDLTKGLRFELYEISAEKILCQTKKPENIYTLCNRII